MKNRLSRYRAILLFVLEWLFVLVLLIILPIESRFPNYFESMLLSAIFVLITAISALVCYIGLVSSSKRVVSSRSYRKLSIRKARFIVEFSSINSILGVILIFYDRVVIRGIDYSKGLRAARYQWAASQGGSLASVLGNLLVPLSYCALFISLLHWESLNKRYRIWGIVAGITVPVLHAALNGGRSNVLLVAIFSLVILIIRKYIGLSLIPHVKAGMIKVAVIVVILISYVISIFLSSRSGSDIHTYTGTLVSFLGGQLKSQSTNVALDIFILIFSYLFHGQWRFGQILGLSTIEKEGTTSFWMVFIDIFRRLGLYFGNITGVTVTESTFLNCPGTLVYDFGVIGLFLGGLISGILFGIAIYLLSFSQSRTTGFGEAYILGVLMFIYCTPVIVVFGFAYFKFIIYAFVLMEIITRILFGKSSWVVLEET